MTEAESLLSVGVAALGGLAVGIEREWSAQQSRSRAFGGVRTFLLLGMVGGLAARASERLGAGVAVAILAAAGALVAGAYVVSALRGGPHGIDATTEVAAVVVLGGGFLAGLGELITASAIFAATSLVLAEKRRLHGAVEKLRTEEIQAAARFAVLALVVLPLLPSEPMAQLGGLEPRKLWMLVLLFSGLSFAGYVALRVAGPSRGLGLAGLLGGVVSSTAVTLNFARESRARPELGAALGWGALAASAVMPVRVAILTAVLNRDVARALLPVAGAAAVIGVVFVVCALVRKRKVDDADDLASPRNPLRLFAAIQMTALFAVVLWLLDFARAKFGSLGVLAGAALLGLTDLDALTLSMTRMAGGGLAAGEAARALALGMLANTAFKAGVALVVGKGRYRVLVASGLAAYAAVFGFGVWWLG